MLSRDICWFALRVIVSLGLFVLIALRTFLRPSGKVQRDGDEIFHRSHIYLSISSYVNDLHYLKLCSHSWTFHPNIFIISNVASPHSVVHHRILSCVSLRTNVDARYDSMCVVSVAARIPPTFEQCSILWRIVKIFTSHLWLTFSHRSLLRLKLYIACNAVVKTDFSGWK